LGIQLMPRIRNWKHLVLYRSNKDTHYQHIDALFAGTVDWDLIATHLPDMLRVGVSIAAGNITPSTILRRLGTYSRKNHLYQAFRELGVAVRTAFLLQYVGDAELRSTIQAATNKSESFNDFVKWLAFGGAGLTHPSDRHRRGHRGRARWRGRERRSDRAPRAGPGSLRGVPVVMAAKTTGMTLCARQQPVCSS